MSYQQIEVERLDAIGIVRLNRPRFRNAQSRVLLEEMNQAFAELDNDTHIKVIILEGAGDHFSAGHDLGTPEETADAEMLPFGRAHWAASTAAGIFSSIHHWPGATSRNPPSRPCRATAYSGDF